MILRVGLEWDKLVEVILLEVVVFIVAMVRMRVIVIIVIGYVMIVLIY